jgi:uncharacterized membrane protein
MWLFELERLLLEFTTLADTWPVKMAELQEITHHSRVLCAVFIMCLLSGPIFSAYMPSTPSYALIQILG